MSKLQDATKPPLVGAPIFFNESCTTYVQTHAHVKEMCLVAAAYTHTHVRRAAVKLKTVNSA